MKPILSVSVVIPCYNSSKHIQNVILSVQNQTRQVNEIIVIDDASTDQSAALVEKCNAKLIRHATNRGPAVARNTGFTSSTSEIVVFIDSDAYADPKMIENLLICYQQFTDDTHLVGVGGRGIDVYRESLPDLWRSLHARQDFGEKPRINVEYLVGLCCSYKRSVLEEIGGFDNFYPTNAGEDLDIGLRIRRAGYHLAYTPVAFVHHQHRDTLENLKKVQFNWTYWNYIARKRNHLPTQKIYLGVLRRLVVNTMYDLIIQRSPRLAEINLDLFPIKIKALQKARKTPTDS